MGSWLPWIIAIAAAATASAFDLRTRRVPNKLSGPVLLAALVWATLFHGLNGLGNAVAGAAIAGLPFFFLWVIGWYGAGDAKLMFALGAWVGAASALPLVLAVALCGGVVSVVYALSKQSSVGGIASQFAVLLMTLPLVLAGNGGARRLSAVTARSERVPYSLATLGGACAAFAWVMLWQS